MKPRAVGSAPSLGWSCSALVPRNLNLISHLVMAAQAVATLCGPQTENTSLRHAFMKPVSSSACILDPQDES